MVQREDLSYSRSAMAFSASSAHLVTTSVSLPPRLLSRDKSGVSGIDDVPDPLQAVEILPER